MKYMILLMFAIAITVMTTGCFDSSPPTGVTGELVGCITSNGDLYCTTKYADAGVGNATTVLIGEIDFEITRSQSFSEFDLHISYTDDEGEEEYRTIQVESLRSPHERMFGDNKPSEIGGSYARVFPGDTIAVAIVNPPTIVIPHQGYIIANLTRPDVEFEIPEEVGDIDILDLTP